MGQGGHGNGRRRVGVDVGSEVARTFSPGAARVGGSEDDRDVVFVGQAVGQLRDGALWVVISVTSPGVGDDTDVVRVLARDGMRIGPFKTLNTCENRGAVASPKRHELSALGHAGSTTSRGIAVAGDGTANVGSVARGGV